MAFKILSEKVSYTQDADELRILILGKTDRWKQSLLLGWVLAWIFCGGVVISEYIKSTDGDLKLVLIVFLIFWAYYFWRIGRVLIYRLEGNELISLRGDTLRIKRSFYTYGKAEDYDISNIEDFRKVELDIKSFSRTYENSWWVLGGEKLAFDVNGRFIKFAMQVAPNVQQQLYTLLNKAIKKNLKNQS